MVSDVIGHYKVTAELSFFVMHIIIINIIIIIIIIITIIIIINIIIIIVIIVIIIVMKSSPSSWSRSGSAFYEHPRRFLVQRTVDECSYYRVARNFCGSLFLKIGDWRDFLCFAGTNFCHLDRLVFLTGNWFFAKERESRANHWQYFRPFFLSTCNGNTYVKTTLRFAYPV